MSLLLSITIFIYLAVAIFRLAVNVYVYHDAYNDHEKEHASRKARRAFLWPLDTLKAIQDAFHGK